MMQDRLMHPTTQATLVGLLAVAMTCLFSAEVAAQSKASPAGVPTTCCASALSATVPSRVPPPPPPPPPTITSKPTPTMPGNDPGNRIFSDVRNVVPDLPGRQSETIDVRPPKQVQNLLENRLSQLTPTLPAGPDANAKPLVDGRAQAMQALDGAKPLL